MALDPIAMTPQAGAGNPIVDGKFRGAFMRKALSGGAPVDQIYANNAAPYPLLTFNQAIYDTDGFWNAARQCFVIPKGISKIQLTGQVVINTNNVGLRQLLIQKSEPGSTFFDFFTGSPIHNTMAVTGTTTDIAVTSAWLPVVEGEGYALLPLQSSGGDLGISGGIGTFFAIEGF